MTAQMIRALATAAIAASLAAAPTPAKAATRCQEDAPCWDWAVMGDHQRGVTTIGGGFIAVTPCRFQRLLKAHRLTYRPVDFMPGDVTAMRARCGARGQRP